MGGARDVQKCRPARPEFDMNRTNPHERRTHRRLELRLPLEYQKFASGRANAFRTMTINVSTGGVYFETTSEDFRTGDQLALELAVPPGDGRFPQHSRISTLGQVVRIDEIKNRPDTHGHTFTRYGIAAQFQKGFRLIFADNITSSSSAFTTL